MFSKLTRASYHSYLQFAEAFCSRGVGGRCFAVLAVNLSSLRTGGAILGDRIRTDQVPRSCELYIRSVGWQTNSVSLAVNLLETPELMEGHGFDALLKMVGVDHVGYVARMQVDALVLVLLPASGDMVGAMKADSMEMADIFVLDIADLPLALCLGAKIRCIASTGYLAPRQWCPPALTAEQHPESVAALCKAIQAYQQCLDAARRSQAMPDTGARYRSQRFAERLVASPAETHDADLLYERLTNQVQRVLQGLADWVGAATDTRSPSTRPQI